MNLPVTYLNQDGCHNCRHCFVKTDYDQGAEYYCTFNAPPRPQCGSSGMGECKTSHDDDEDWNAQNQERIANQELWYQWARPREVMPWGICGRHEAIDQPGAEA